jgi:hypothetical protein
LNDFIVLKFPLVAREDVKDGRRPFERKRAGGDCGGENTALMPFMPFMPLVPFVCCLDEVGLGDSIIGDGACGVEGCGVEGCGVLMVTTDSVERLELTEKRIGDGEGGLSGFGGSSKTSSVLRAVGVGVVGATRGGIDTDEEGDESASGKDLLITGLGLAIASGAV